ncbi:uncharacterized protein LOC128990275 isoform X2 [Macrosteles quadrilineatus]|uniref:uncharacterized protein LOC128990275 isoform X2 n=1 Tax=Macrosteles quadrilineatus TaxID=74068 RepID=UPI0023E0E4B7|nr:uncharacterized protein LOC128990275 isoform X2 [Macrosteles quadrilineatus]
MIPIHCPLCCDQPFDDQDALFHHLRSLRNNLFCPICSERFSSLDLLIKHLSRKCDGPLSPREAKRKCLYNQNKLLEMLPGIPPTPPSSLEPANSSDSLESMRSAGVVVASPASTPAVAQQPTPLKHKLSSSVSLRPLHTILPSQQHSKLANNSLSVVLNPISFHPSVDISFTPGKAKGTSLEQSILLGLGKGSQPKVVLPNHTQSSTSNHSRKVGPLSSKLKEKGKKSLEVQTEDTCVSKGLKKSLEVQTEDTCVSKGLKKSLEVQTEDTCVSKGLKKSLEVQTEDTCVSKGLLLVSNEEKTRGEEKVLTKSNTNAEVSKKSIMSDTNQSPTVNGVTIVEKTPNKTTNNKRPHRKSKANPTPEVTELVSHRRTRGKKICYSKLLSDHDDGFGDDSSDHVEDDISDSSKISERKESKNLVGSPKKDEKTSDPTINAINKDLNGKLPDITNSVPLTTNLDSVKSSPTENSTDAGRNEGVDSLAKESNTSKEEAKDVLSSDEQKAEEDEEEYTCSACNIRFTSIYEHIKQYHNGQEVVVEVPEEEIKEDLKAYQETSESLVSISGPEATDTPTPPIDKGEIPEVKNEITSPCPEAKTAGKKDTSEVKNGITSPRPKAESRVKNRSLNTEDSENDSEHTKTPKKAKNDTEEHWEELRTEKKKFYHFVRNREKFNLLLSEFKNNLSIHPEFKTTMNSLFESPKINVVEITYREKTPYFANRTVNLNNPMPIFIVDREATDNPALLGGIASFVMAGKDRTPVPSDSKLIAVMKVILASDRELTVENLVFNDKPLNADMVPVLEDVKTPEIPLLKHAKMLKWRCNKCLGTTWKFPVHKDSHLCNACPICHQSFTSPVSLKKHLVLHRKDGTKYCTECRAAFVSKEALNRHLTLHTSHVLCDKCQLFVQRELFEIHKDVHSSDLSEQFPCSVCKKVFGSGEDLNKHETKVCSKLVARFNCFTCDKKFLSKTALMYHTKAHENSPVKLKCRFCPKIFIEEMEQIWHERIHTRERPYMCKSCPKWFRTKHHEAQHSSTAHSTSNTSTTKSVRFHMCTYCDKVFSGERQLHKHMQKHTK